MTCLAIWAKKRRAACKSEEHYRSREEPTKATRHQSRYVNTSLAAPHPFRYKSPALIRSTLGGAGPGMQSHGRRQFAYPLISRSPGAPRYTDDTRPEWPQQPDLFQPAANQWQPLPSIAAPRPSLGHWTWPRLRGIRRLHPEHMPVAYQAPLPQPEVPPVVIPPGEAQPLQPLARWNSVSIVCRVRRLRHMWRLHGLRTLHRPHPPRAICLRPVHGPLLPRSLLRTALDRHRQRLVLERIRAAHHADAFSAGTGPGT